MGYLSDLFRASTPVTRAAAVVDVPVGTAATSEGALRELDPVAAAAFGIGDGTGGPVTRELAMTVPGIRRGRALIAGTAGTLDLVATRDRAGVREQVTRSLLTQPDPATTPAYALTWTVDDMLFRGVSWWRVLSRDSEGYPAHAERIEPARIFVDQVERRVYVDNVHVPDRDLIRFDGPDEGVLSYGGPTIRLALALARAGQRVADDDWSGLALRLAEGAPELSDDQITALLNAWEDARRRRTTAFLNRAVDPHNVGVNAKDRELTDLSQLVASELARLMNLPASRIGAPQGSGMTYANTEADRRDLVDTTLRQYLTPITQRLSMPDVTPGGTTVAFDLAAYVRGDTAAAITAAVQATARREDGTQLMTDDEARTRLLGLPPIPREDTPA